MKKLRVLSIVLFVLGIVLIIMGGLEGELRVGFFLVFPFIVGSGLYVVVGFLLMLCSLFLFVLGSPTRPSLNETGSASPEEHREQKRRVEGGGVVLVGPIPIIIGSSWKITLTLILATIILVLLAFFLFTFRF